VKMRTVLLRALLLGSAVSLALLADGVTPASAVPSPTCNESGTISTDTTWDSSCVHVVSSVLVTSGTLTIDPGAIVKMDTVSSTPITVFGNAALLQANGTAAAPVYFTSLKDDSVGGDTNGDKWAKMTYHREGGQICLPKSEKILRTFGEKSRPRSGRKHVKT